MAGRKTRVIGKRCTRCGKPLSVILDDDEDLKIVDGDAQAICTNDNCPLEGDIVPVDRLIAKTRWEVEP